MENAALIVGLTQQAITPPSGFNGLMVIAFFCLAPQLWPGSKTICVECNLGELSYELSLACRHHTKRELSIYSSNP